MNWTPTVSDSILKMGPLGKLAIIARARSVVLPLLLALPVDQHQHLSRPDRRPAEQALRPAKLLAR